MGEASWDPFDVFGFLVDFRGGLAFDVAAEVEVADGYDQMRCCVFVFRNGRAGGEKDFGNADAVLDEEDFLGGTGRGRVIDGGRVLVVTQKFDGDVAEGLVGKVASVWEKPPMRKRASPSFSFSWTGGLPVTVFSTSESPRVTKT